MKKILVAGVVGILSAYSSAEIVKNSKGEKKRFDICTGKQ